MILKINLLLAILLCSLFSFAQEKMVVVNSDTTYYDVMPDSLEFGILKEFYNSTGGTKWKIKTNWLNGRTSADFAKWYGVKVINGDVAEIVLTSNNLTGMIPSSIYSLDGLEGLWLEGNNLTEQIRAKKSVLRSGFAASLVIPGVEKNLPVWALGVTNATKDVSVDWRKASPSTTALSGSTSSVNTGTAVAIDGCGGIAFYARHTGIDKNYQLNLYSATGVRLTNDINDSPLRALDGVPGSTEMQIVKVPTKTDEWYVIYSLFGGLCGESSVYCKATIVYAKVKYNNGVLTINKNERQILIGSAKSYIHGKAVSRKAGIDSTKHYLYLVERDPNDVDPKMRVHRFTISNTGIALTQSSFWFNSKFWFLSISGSSVELSPDETKLAISNRNESNWKDKSRNYQDIFLFDLNNFSNPTNNPAVINIPDLWVQPDNIVIKRETQLRNFYIKGSAKTRPCFRYLRNKLGKIEFSPSGQYLYVTGGGYPKIAAGQTPSGTYSTYLLQIDLWSVSNGQYDVRIQNQQGVNVSGSDCQGTSIASAGDNFNPIGSIESSFDGNLYFSKGNQGYLFVLPNPNAPMPQKIDPVDVNLAISGSPNILLAGGARSAGFPENIDGYDYVQGKNMPDAQFTLDKSTLGTNVSVTLTVTNYRVGAVYTVDWGDMIIETFTTSTKSHTYATQGNRQVSLKSTEQGCDGTETKPIFVKPCNLSVKFSLSKSQVKPTEKFEIEIQNFSGAFTYIVNLGNGYQTVMETATQTFSYPTSNTYTITVSIINMYGCLATQTKNIVVLPPVALCTTVMPLSPGTFKLDKFSGQIVFAPQDNCLPAQSVSCIEGKVESAQLTNVVSASATTFSDDWGYGFSGTPVRSEIDYENGQRGRWRAKDSYVFNTPINYQINDRNYLAGRFTLSGFNWQSPDVNKKAGWILTNQITKYSAHGEPLEELNALGIASTAKIGYHESVPYLIAQNASYEKVMFESFENVYGEDQNLLEENVALSGGRSTVAHSGKYALTLVNSFVSRSINTSSFDTQVRFWARGDISAATVSVTSTSSTVFPSVIKKISQSGEWSLWESVMPAETAGNKIKINKLGGGEILIDDVRIQPVNAEMTCYVYDPRTLILLAVFDDQHFALFYQYNDEGKLVRKRIETERGIKTVQETQYNTPVTDK